MAYENLYHSDGCGISGNGADGDCPLCPPGRDHAAVNYINAKGGNMVKNILIPIDGSDYGKTAVAYGI
jgi:hypothetical protein